MRALLAVVTLLLTCLPAWGAGATLVLQSPTASGGADFSEPFNATHFAFDLVLSSNPGTDWTAAEVRVTVTAPHLATIWHASDQALFDPNNAGLGQNNLAPNDSPPSDTRAWDTYVNGPGGEFLFTARGGVVSTATDIYGLNPDGQPIPLAWSNLANTDLGVRFVGLRLTLASAPGYTLGTEGLFAVATIEGQTRDADGGFATFAFTLYASPTAANCDPDGIQASGAIYRICMPPLERWNGDLVLFAHGYVDPNEPVAIPEEQLSPGDGPSLPDLVNALGYAFAVTSYRQNGLAIHEGLEDLIDLVEIFEQTYGTPRYVYLTGASEGGLITALGIERHPDVFDAGLSACGPIGHFGLQIAYFGNMRVVFDYFYDLIPGSAVDVPGEVYNHWYDTYVPQIRAALEHEPAVAEEIIRITRAPTDPQDVAGSRITTILGALGYAIRATNDAIDKLGGLPVGNRGVWYTGASQPLRFNLLVERFRADPDAIAEVNAHYQTSGVFSRPLIVLHTTGDEIIPYWQAVLYAIKVLLAGVPAPYANLAVERYGHCNFEAEELLASFAVLVLLTQGQELSGAEALLPDAAAVQRYHERVDQLLYQVQNPGQLPVLPGVPAQGPVGPRPALSP